MSVKCGGALWGRERTHTSTNPPAPPASPLATAAVLQEAAVPLADQILSVTFPLINGHLLPPFSRHGYTLCLCRSSHLIITTFNLIRASRPRLCSPATLLPATRQLGRREGRKTNKPMRQYSSGRLKSHCRFGFVVCLFVFCSYSSCQTSCSTHSCSKSNITHSEIRNLQCGKLSSLPGFCRVLISGMFKTKPKR